MFSNNFNNKSLFDYIQGFDNAQCLYSQSIVDTVYGWFKKECHGKNSKNDNFFNQSLYKKILTLCTDLQENHLKRVQM